MYKSLITIAAGLSLALVQLGSTSTVAANPPSSQAPSGITVSPAFQQVQIPGDQSQKQLQFTITNNRPATETIILSTQDFNALSDSGGLFFVGTNPTQLQKKYGLANWLRLSQTSITLPAHQSQSLPVLISNDSTLAPGGHYGALMLALNSSNVKTVGRNVIAVHPIASSLLFVNKIGGDTHKLKLSSVDAGHGLFSLPGKVTLRFYNDGNTHLIPRGTVTITSPNGKLVSRGIINENSDLILPQIYRQYSVPLAKVATVTSPGNYKLMVNFRFDGIDQYRAYQSNIFLAIPSTLVLILVIFLLIIGIGFYYFRHHDAKKPSPKTITTKKAVKISVQTDE